MRATYNPQKQPGKVRKTANYTEHSAGGKYRGGYESRKPYHNADGLLYPSDILPLAHISNADRKWGFESLKSIDTYAYLIATYSNPGDWVLDPTAGSFASGVAAYRLGRNYIGIEKDFNTYERGVIWYNSKL